MEKVSVVLTCWKRFKNFEKIIKMWLEEPQVDEVLIWDNSGGFKTTLPVIVINSNHNFGASARYALGTLVKNDIVMFCDDDIIPKTGFLSEMLPYFKPNRLLGVTGRFFKGDYRSGFDNQYEADKISSPLKVDFIVGYLMMIHKDNLLGFNYRNSSWYCCELELQGKLIERGIEVFVVPSKNWEHLPEQWDTNALSSKPEAETTKEEMYQKYYGSKS